MEGGGGTEERAPRSHRTSRWGTRVSAAGGALERQHWPETGECGTKKVKGHPRDRPAGPPMSPMSAPLQPPLLCRERNPEPPWGRAGVSVLPEN